MSTDDNFETWHGLMLHAAGSSPRALGGLINQLESRGVRVSAPPLPMRVTPEDGARGTPFASHVALAKATLEGFGTRRRVIFGHSFGGLVALLALLDGAQVDVAVLYEPIVLSVLDGGDVADQAAKRRDRELIDVLDECVSAGDREGGVRRFIEAFNEVRWDELSERARAGIVADAADIRDVACAVHHLAVPIESLKALDTKVVVMSGSESLDVTQRMAARLAHLLPRATHVVVQEGGHMAPALRPQPVAEVILATLSDLVAGRSVDDHARR